MLSTKRLSERDEEKTRYKSQLAGKLKGFIEWELEHYHEYKRTLEQIRNDMIPSPTPKYTDEPHGNGGESRPTEGLGIKIATNVYIQKTEQTVNAISYVLSKLNPIDLKLIELVYFKQQYTVEGAAVVVNYSKTTAYSHINAVLIAIAKELGYVDAI